MRGIDQEQLRHSAREALPSGCPPAASRGAGAGAWIAKVCEARSGGECPLAAVRGASAAPGVHLENGLAAPRPPDDLDAGTALSVPPVPSDEVRDRGWTPRKLNRPERLALSVRAEPASANAFPTSHDVAVPAIPSPSVTPEDRRGLQGARMPSLSSHSLAGARGYSCATGWTHDPRVATVLLGPS